MPKHTQRSKVTPHISYGRVAVETQSENTFVNSWQSKLEANSTLKLNLQKDGSGGRDTEKRWVGRWVGG